MRVRLIPSLQVFHILLFCLWPAVCGQVSSTELKKLQGIKSGMNKLLSRVNKVKQELESILDDDADMVVRHNVSL